MHLATLADSGAGLPVVYLLIIDLAIDISAGAGGGTAKGGYLSGDADSLLAAAGQLLLCRGDGLVAAGEEESQQTDRESDQLSQ